MVTTVKLTLSGAELGAIIKDAARAQERESSDRFTTLCWPDEGVAVHATTSADGTVTLSWED